MRDVDGKNVVWISENILSSKPKNQSISDFIVDYLTSHVGEMYSILESGRRVYLGEDLPNEYAWSKYSQRIRSQKRRLYKDKAKAIAGIGEAINIATNRRWEPTKHSKNKDAKYGIYKYDSKIAFPVYNAAGENTGVHAYDVTLVIRNASDGRKYLYDVQNIKNDAVTADTLYFKSMRATEKIAQQERIASEQSIAPSDGSVKYSLRENDRKYMDAVEHGNTAEAEKLVDAAAKAAGYKTCSTMARKMAAGLRLSVGGRTLPRTRAMPSGTVNLETRIPFIPPMSKWSGPLTRRIPEVRELFDEARMEYGMGQLQDTGLPDWTDGYDLSEYIEENDLPYDGIVLDEGGTCERQAGKPWVELCDSEFCPD